MALTREQIKTAALQLDPLEREALAKELLLSVSVTEREAIDAAWLAAARRRDERFLASQTRAKPVEEVIDRLTRRIRP